MLLNFNVHYFSSTHQGVRDKEGTCALVGGNLAVNKRIYIPHVPLGGGVKGYESFVFCHSCPLTHSFFLASHTSANSGNNLIEKCQQPETTRPCHIDRYHR